MLKDKEPVSIEQPKNLPEREIVHSNLKKFCV
jgi:hypothetical protein